MIEDFKKTTVLVTNICNSKCEDCYVRSKSHDNQVISIEVIKKMFKMYKKPRHLTISGGEPTLVLPEVEKLLKDTSDINTKIITNGWWGGNNKVESQLLKLIDETGLNIVQISCGIEHQKWTPIANILRSIDVIISGGKSVNVEVIYEIKHYSEKQNIIKYFKEHSELYGDRFKAASGYWNNVCDQKYANGRAGQDAKLEAQWCDKLDGVNILIRYDGEVYRCCGAYIVGVGEPYSLGNIKNNYVVPFSRSDAYAEYFLALNNDTERIVNKRLADEKFKKMHRCEQCNCMTLKRFDMEDGRYV